MMTGSVLASRGMNWLLTELSVELSIEDKGALGSIGIDDADFVGTPKLGVSAQTTATLDDSAMWTFAQAVVPSMRFSIASVNDPLAESGAAGLLTGTDVASVHVAAIDAVRADTVSVNPQLDAFLSGAGLPLFSFGVRAHTADRTAVAYSGSDADDRTLLWRVGEARTASAISPERTDSDTGDWNYVEGDSTMTSMSLASSSTTSTFSTSATDASSSVFQTRVAASGDDVEERGTGSLSNNTSDLELVDDGSSRQTVGLRFTSVDIPRGAIITSAYVQFQADEVSSGAASLLIRGEDTDDAAGFTSTRFGVSSRTPTEASTTWEPPDWTAVGEAGLAQRTADISAIVQEIVDRDGWAALNNMVFLITGTGTRTAESYEGSSEGAPLLHVEFIPPEPLSDPVTFESPPDVDPTANQIAELAAAGTSVGIIASATDPDADDTVTYSIDDPRFAIDATTGSITRSAEGSLDFETEPSIILTVTATSSDTSTAIETFTLEVLDSPEPVAFNTPSDADPAANRIGENAEAGTTVGITASADDPDGDTVTYAVDDPRFTIDPVTGMINRSDTGTLDAMAEPSIILTVTATSSDQTTDTETFDVSVISSVNQLPTSVSLINTVLTSQWNPPSPDPSGIAYVSHLGTMLISDGEVNEMSNLFTGDNVFQMTLAGELIDASSTISFSDEPTGVAYNPTNRHLYFSDDTGTRSVYEVDPGPDGLYSTSDDVVTSFRTAAFGCSDPEGLAYDPGRGTLYIAGGADELIFTVDPGPNGKFDGVPSVGGDDLVSSFSTQPLGIHDPEGIEYDPDLDVLYITATRQAIAMVTPTGELLGTLDISEANTRNPAGLALGPSSIDPTRMSLYLADRGVDNNSNPDENDGKVFEFMFDDWLLA